ncbi:DUF6634 family protein [Paracoccus rhizosphaerae]|uniref:DUF6634 family protein n=1 Tax=Paracoccus rhizosphaerae TaxID=1133347 RepID=A0ABV6CHY5_9RHOB|nr:DUF6634 family protein [Paracoccus rhizosphaerae]
MHNPQSFIDLAKASVAALERGPTPEDLAEAPLADLWAALVKDEDDLPALWAQVLGHPLLGDRQILTSALVGLNRDAGWARTISRWYRLGTPFPSAEVRLASSVHDRKVTSGYMPLGSTGYLALVDNALLEAKMTRFVSLLKNLDAHMESGALGRRLQ